jgi:hypothetical protein
MFMGGSADGPFVSLWDSTGKRRVLLRVEKDVATVTLYPAELKEAVPLQPRPDDGRGLAAVLDNGRRRPCATDCNAGGGACPAVHRLRGKTGF